jgi:hypothetical protein
MNRGAVLGFVVLLAAPTMAMAQGSLERGRYLVDTVMTCQNCHTPKGPNGPQFDKAVSGGLRFDEPRSTSPRPTSRPIATPASAIGATPRSRRRCRRAGGLPDTSLLR